MGEDKEKDKNNNREPAIGRRFQNEIKYSPGKMGGYTLDWNSIPKPYKHYESPLAIIQLPEPHTKSEPNLWKLLMKRRSRREYSAGRQRQNNR